MNNLFSEINNLIITKCVIKKGQYILRTRKDLFNTEADISYNPKPSTTYGRFSPIGTKRFYGTICESPFISLLTSIIETHTTTQADYPSFTTYSTGLWKIKQDLTLAAIITDKIFPKSNNAILNLLKQEYTHFIPNCTKQQIEKTENIATELTKKYSNNNDYKRISTITDIVLYNCPQYDGFIYPSIETHGKYVMNVALKTNIVDNHLQFQNISHNIFVQLHL